MKMLLYRTIVLFHGIKACLIFIFANSPRFGEK